MGLKDLLEAWPVVRQVREGDLLGTGKAAQSARSQALRPRLERADKVVHSICPFCAVGCGQLVYVEDGAVTQVEGDPASPSRADASARRARRPRASTTGRCASTGSSTAARTATAWEELPLETAMDMIVDRILAARDADWDAENRRTMSIANLGGATLDNEENYLIKKLLTALGVVQVENQARI